MVYKHRKSSTPLRGAAAVNKTVMQQLIIGQMAYQAVLLSQINCLRTAQIKVTMKQVIGPYFVIMNKAVCIIEIRYRNTK